LVWTVPHFGQVFCLYAILDEGISAKSLFIVDCPPWLEHD
jgi:hypothetical protein